MTPTPGSRVGQYEIIDQLGAGGMGVVYLARDARLERNVAVKLLAEDAQGDASARERFRREALAAAGLDHPFICKIHEVGEHDGRPFIVMEYIEGQTLAAVARNGPVPIRQVLDIAHELAQALEAAHRKGLVHRDLKPGNVMVTEHGHVKVLDFGLAKQIGGDPRTAFSTGGALTDAGTRLGTPAYMSPEQILGGDLDPRSDIFSLGTMVYELVAGAHPFMRASAADTMAAIMRDAPAGGDRDLDTVPGLGPVVHRMLAKACGERHQSTSALRADLEALRERSWSSTPSAAPAASGSSQPQERTPFVARESEIGELQKALDRMLVGQGSFMLLGGEPGVGKTRLAREIQRLAHQRGCLVTTGQCYEQEGAPPYGPFVEIIEQGARTLPQAFRAALGDSAPEIAAMVPSLRRIYHDIADAPVVPPDQQRRLLFSAYLDHVRRVTLKSALVVLFDDLHWADDSSLQLLLHLAPHLGSMRLLLVGTYRDVELDTERPFAKTLETLLRQRLATRIQVKRLTAAGVEQMLHRLSGTSPPSSLVRVLHQETDGNPFFVEEVYQHLAEERKLFDASGVWKPNLRAEEIDVPEGVRLVISRRLQRLGDEARRVLSAAAIIGSSFPLDLLGAVADAPEDTILDVVEQAERAQLVVAERSRDTRYAFVHELIRSTLINNLSLPRRQRLHLKIADVLERLRAASLGSHASVLAHHLYQAGAAVESGRTAKFLLLAGRRALTAGAFEEALETCDQVLGLELPEHDPRLGEASEHRGQGLAGLQRHDDAIAAFDRALAIYSAGGDDAGIERAASGAANCYVWRGPSAESAASLARGLNALSKGAARERALLLAGFAASRMSPAHIDEAWQRLDEAMALAEHVADPAVLERTLIGKSFCQRMCFEHEASTATARQALSLPHAGSLWDRADLLVGLVTCQFYLGRFANCEELLPELEAAAGRAGHHGALWVGEYIQRWIGAHRTGDLRGLLEHTEQALGERYFWYFSRTTVGLCGLYLGAVDRALAQLESVVVEQPSDFWAQGMPEANLFAATALSGQCDRARALIPTVVPWLPVSGRRNVQGAFVALEAFVTGLTLTGDRDHCAALYPLTLDYIRTGQVCAGTIVGPGNPQLAAALAADAAGLADQSREHFETALRQAREVPMRILQPTVLYWYGCALSATPDGSDRSRGRAMAETALTDFRALGMVLHANLAERFLHDGRYDSSSARAG